MKTVKDMYKYTSDNTLKLLSDYNADFWADYKTNYARYDKLFCRLYRSWFYFLQEHDETIAQITTNFTADVYAHLLLNEKKYSELYRINVIDDTKYSLLDNYDMTESMDRDTTSNNTNTYGQRTDQDNTGMQTYSEEKTVAAYNESSYQPDNNTTGSTGSRQDSHIKGSQSDTLNNTGTEDYTLHRYGNIGVSTATDMMAKAKDFWTVWEFYEMIFRDIARELLMIGG